MVQLRRRNFITPKLLPLTKDIRRLVEELKSVMKESYRKLKENPDDVNAYSELAKSLLAFLIMFNRRRSGETAKLELSTIQRSGLLDNPVPENSGISEEVMKSLTSFEKTLVKKLKRIETLGKACICICISAILPYVKSMIDVEHDDTIKHR